MITDYIKMDDRDNNAVQFVVAKILSMWTLIGVSTWGEAASVIAFVYTLCLLSEWLFKKYRALRDWRAGAAAGGGK